jgi:hypothetical protein
MVLSIRVKQSSFYQTFAVVGRFIPRARRGIQSLVNLPYVDQGKLGRPASHTYIDVCSRIGYSPKKRQRKKIN